MDPWQKETLGLQVGDWIIWRDEAIEMEGQPAVVEPGMRGEVLSLHDGFHLDVAQGEPIPPKAISPEVSMNHPPTGHLKVEPLFIVESF